MFNGQNSSFLLTFLSEIEAECISCSTMATFEFTKEDYARIILTDSLFNDSNTDPTGGVSTATLKKLQEKETRLFLHAVTLSDYLRVNKIPMGLRIINKIPMWGRESDTFCDRWCEVLNKCSYDLMALTIQEVSSQLATVREEIVTQKKALSDSINNKDRLDQIMEECDNRKRQLEAEIIAYKRKKFERDSADYQSGAVYGWRLKTPEAEVTSTNTNKKGRRRNKKTWPKHGMSTRNSPARDSDSNSEGSGFLGADSGLHERRNADAASAAARLPPRGTTPKTGRGKTH